jgi:hypothetical protein
MPPRILSAGAFAIVWRSRIKLGLACILVLATWFRLTAYGDLRLSVATMDTESYVLSAQTPTFSRGALTGERLFTTNLLYRFARAQNCRVEALSIPAIGKESRREVQACFSGVVLTQSLLSILAWGFLILSFTSTLRQNAAKLIAAVVLSVFAFAPQLADWDSILTSESLTFSLFALAVGLIIQVVRVSTEAEPETSLTLRTLAWAGGAAFVLIVWLLVRDANLYTLLVLCLMSVPGALLLRPPRPALFAATAALLCASLIALASAFESGRWKIPLTDALDEYILPFPARVAAFQKMGMPSPDVATYQDWFDHRAPSAYMRFLIGHPGFASTTLMANLNSLFGENNQPYFKTPTLPLRNTALGVGDVVHTKSSSAALADVLIVGTLAAIARRPGARRVGGVAWIACWLLVSAAATLFVTFFADPIGVERHVLFGLFLFRLLEWTGLMLLVDLALDNHERSSPDHQRVD